MSYRLLLISIAVPTLLLIHLPDSLAQRSQFAYMQRKMLQSRSGESVESKKEKPAEIVKPMKKADEIKD